MKEHCQALGKGQLNLEDVVAAVEDLLYQVDVPKDNFSSFLKGAMADRKKKQAGKAKSPSSQTAFEKFNCSFEDLFGSDIGAFQDSIHFFDKPKSIATLDLVSQRPQQTEDDDFSVSSSSSGILPPPRDTVPRSRAKELARQKEKLKSEVVASPIKVKQRMSIKSLGRVNSPRRRTRAVRPDPQGPASVMSLDLMHDFSEESKGSSGGLMSDHSENKRRGKKTLVASSQGQDDVAKAVSQERSVKKKPDLPSEKPSRRSEESPRRRTESPRRTTQDGIESPRRRRRTSRVDDDTATVKSHSVKTSKRTDERSVSPRRRCDDRSAAPRRRSKSLTGHDTLTSKMKNSTETVTCFTRKVKPDVSKYSDERSVVSRKTTKASSHESSDRMASLVRKASVCKRLSNSDHASPSSTQHNVDPLSKSDHMTRRRLSRVMTERPN
jgi:hypothetical protein